MLKFGESYLVTLKDSIVLSNGQWKHCIYGDYKGTSKCDVTEVKYIQIGDILVEASNAKSFVKTDAVNLGRVEIEQITDGYVNSYTVDSYIGNAYGTPKK
jgi:hypothetical protein